MQLTLFCNQIVTFKTAVHHRQLLPQSRLDLRVERLLPDLIPVWFAVYLQYNYYIYCGGSHKDQEHSR